MKRRVVVSGIGCVTAAGIGKAAFWNTLVAGRSALTPMTGGDDSNLPVKVAGIVAVKKESNRDVAELVQDVTVRTKRP